MRRLPFVAVLVLWAGSSCRHVPVVPGRLEPEHMERLASELVYLTAAVEAVVYDQSLPAGLRDDEIIAFATRHDPTIAAPFARYRVRIQRGERDAVLLVCTADSTRGLIEDATCTSGPDRHLWNEPAPQPCQFTSDVATACPAGSGQ